MSPQNKTLPANPCRERFINCRYFLNSTVRFRRYYPFVPAFLPHKLKLLLQTFFAYKPLKGLSGIANNCRHPETGSMQPEKRNCLLPKASAWAVLDQITERSFSSVKYH
jgi:hypothetical protein